MRVAKYIVGSVKVKCGVEEEQNTKYGLLYSWTPPLLSAVSLAICMFGGSRDSRVIPVLRGRSK